MTCTDARRVRYVLEPDGSSIRQQAVWSRAGREAILGADPLSQGDVAVASSGSDSLGSRQKPRRYLSAGSMVTPSTPNQTGTTTSLLGSSEPVSLTNDYRTRRDGDSNKVGSLLDVEKQFSCATKLSGDSLMADEQGP